MEKELRIAYFVSSHGYGHAARSTAVMQALLNKSPNVKLEIFTQTPKWFFSESLGENFGYHFCQTDVGLYQCNPLYEDVEKTLIELNKFYPVSQEYLDNLSKKLTDCSADLVICDISPLGILAAQKAGIPSVLVENFTWDWIYMNYLPDDMHFNAHIQYLGSIFSSSDYHIKTIPYCQNNGTVDLVANPVGRKPLSSRESVRKKLGIADSEKVVLISMGGIPDGFKFLYALQKLGDVRFVIPEGGLEEVKVEKNCIRLPRHSDYYHPDLVNSADLVLGKAGYSTIAEVYHAGIPFAFFSRPTFREAEVLQVYIETELSGKEIKCQDFDSDVWKKKIYDLLKLEKVSRPGTYGNDQIADFVVDEILK